MLEGLPFQVTHILDIDLIGIICANGSFETEMLNNIILTGIFFLQSSWGAVFLANWLIKLYIFH